MLLDIAYSLKKKEEGKKNRKNTRKNAKKCAYVYKTIQWTIITQL